MSEATLADFPIYDCDSHWTEPPDLWQSRAPASMRDAMPRVRDIDGTQWWFAGDMQLGPIGLSVVRRDGGKVYVEHRNLPTRPGR